MKQLQDHAQQVWMLPNVDDKKAILRDMVENFDHKNNTNTFLTKIEQLTSADKLDELAANIMLTGADLKVIR